MLIDMVQDSKIETIIFDLDDTLLDTRSALLHARIEIIKSLIEISDNADVCRALNQWERLAWYYKSSDLERIISIIKNEFGKGNAISGSVIKKAEKKYRDIELENISIFSEVNLLVKTCAKIGLKVGIFGNGNPDFQVKKMKKFREFEDVLKSDSFNFADGYNIEKKPSPFGLLGLLSKMECPPQTSIYIGDRVTDVLAAKNAGCYSIMIPAHSMETKMPPLPVITNHEKPDISLSSLQNLNRLIRIGNYEMFNI